MKAKLVENNINFERGMEPKDSLKLGKEHSRKQLQAKIDGHGERIMEKGLIEDYYEKYNAVSDILDRSDISFNGVGSECTIKMGFGITASINEILLELVKELVYDYEDYSIRGENSDELFLEFHVS